jgi:DNA-binding transcriptional LysR family regulator
MDRLEAMSILVASAEAVSFTAAGRQLGVPLPTISRKVSDLESHLNTQLLVRSPRRLSLTDAGVAYVAACKRILEQVDEAESQASGEYTVPRGTLVVTAPIVFGRPHIVPVVNDFLAKFAQINVHLTLSDQTLNLVDEHIDLAVRVGARCPIAHSSRQRSAKSVVSCAAAPPTSPRTGRRRRPRTSTRTCV